MKSALELHKDILQGLQTIDSFSQDMFLPEELDLHLNRIQDSFINELLDKGFADRQLRLDYIEKIIVKNKPLPIFISPTAFYYESGAVTSLLPGGYKHLLSTKAGVIKGKDCNIINEKVKEATKYFSFLELKETSTEPPYYSKVEIIKVNADQSETLVASTSFPVTDIEDTYLIIRNLIHQANNKFIDVEFYWEKYSDTERQGLIKNNTFIILDEKETIYKLVIYDKDGNEKSSVTNSSENQKIEVFDESALKNLTPVEYTSTTLLNNEEIYDRKQNVFFFPKYKNPHTLISDGILFNYYEKDFLITEIYIDYIREPQPISLALSQGCELSVSAANIIVNRVVEYLKLAIENPAYKEVLQHNELREQK